MTIDDAVSEFLIYSENVQCLSPNSIVAYRNDLKNFTAFCGGGQIDMASITLDQLHSCIGILSRKGRATSSINRFISSVRDLFAYCRKFNYISINVSLKLKNLKMPKQIPRFMTQKEVDDICIMPNENPLLWEKRDKAIVEVLYSTGCRVSEIENLKMRDISFDKKSAIVKGKGNKDRQVFFGADARKALDEYFVERKARFPLLDDSSSVFLNQRGGGLTRRGIALVLSRYSGVEGTNHHVSPHTFRHTFATAMLSNGADVRVIQEMLGHSQISTTQKYTHITQEQLINTYNKAFPHGRRRHSSDDTDNTKSFRIEDSDTELENKK